MDPGSLLLVCGSAPKKLQTAESLQVEGFVLGPPNGSSAARTSRRRRVVSVVFILVRISKMLFVCRVACLLVLQTSGGERSRAERDT